MTHETECTVFMSEKKAAEKEQSHHITVAHFPKPYIWFMGIFITVMLSSVGALFAYVYQEGQVNARQDERLEMLIKDNAKFHKTGRFDLLAFKQHIEPLNAQIVVNKAEIDSFKERSYQQNKEIQLLLNKIVGDIGELKGQIK